MLLATASPHLPLLPAWIAALLTVILCGVVWWHTGSLFRATMPESRRRIRVANAAVTLLLAPVLGLSFGAVHPGLPEIWVVSWSFAISLLALTILLAMLDTANNVRLSLSERQDLKAELAATRAAMRIAATHAAPHRLGSASPDRGQHE
jgi:hypothetical protein